jgi:hypothetical protein
MASRWRTSACTAASSSLRVLVADSGGHQTARAVEQAWPFEQLVLGTHRARPSNLFGVQRVGQHTKVGHHGHSTPMHLRQSVAERPADRLPPRLDTSHFN